MNVNGFTKAAACIMLLLTSACAVKKPVVVDILRPAPQTFPPYTNVAITDRSKLDSVSLKSVYPSNLLTSKFPAIPNFLGTDILSSFYDGIANFPRVRLSEINPLPSVTRKDFKAPALEKSAIEEIAAANPGLEALLTLDGVKYEIYTDGSVYRDQLLLSNGKTIDIPIFSSSYSYKIYTHWRMYDLKTGDVVMERSFSDEMPFYYDGYSMYDRKGYGSKGEQGWQRAAAYTGGRFAAQFIPSWEAQERYIFPGDTQAMLEAADNADLGRWLDAAEKWELYKNRHKLSKSRHAQVNYNLAVAYEVLGKISYARELCEEAYALTNNKSYLEYARKLKIREAETELLDKQFSGQ